MRLMKFFCGMALLGALAACGGGGGSSGSASGGGGSGGSGTTTASPKVVVSVRNSSNAVVNSISFGGAFSAQAVVTDAASAPVANRLVTFNVSNTGIATLPTPATALTDSSGVARVSISPASISSTGAATLSAAASVNSATVTGQTDFAVSPSNVALSPVSVGASNLPSGGNTSVSVTALLNGTAFTGTPVNVTFSASCGRINGVNGNVSVTTNGSGVANATYTALTADGSPCSGAVTLSAATPGATPSTVSLTVAAPVANAVTFVSAAPQQIYLANSGAVNKSLLKFRVFSSGSPLANVAVSFSITLNPGGSPPGAVTLNTTSGTSDSNGEVSVQVSAGTIPGPVRVMAALTSNTAVFAESQNLTVASGPPSQKFMSLSVSTFNIEGRSIDGTSSTLTVRIADRQGNPVDDGTVINFTAEGGQVAQSCATARVAGISQCSVNFISQNPRPANGRVSVLAYTNGAKDFVDANMDNLFNTGDTLVDQGNAYRDDNENGQYDAGEFVLPLGGSGACAGAGEPFPQQAGTCDPSTISTTVRQQAVLLFSSSSADIVPTAIGSSLVSFTVQSRGYVSPTLPMPAGTTVTASIVPVAGSSCAVVGTVLGSPIPNIAPGVDPLANLATQHSINLTGCTPGVGDKVRIDVTAPSGLVSTQQFNLP